MTNENEQSTQRWIDDVEKALNRTTEAVKTAWQGTRESRMSALETAKEAANRLGDAIDQGIELAKESWDRPAETATGSDEEAVTGGGEEE